MHLDRFFDWLTQWVYDGGRVLSFVTEMNINIMGYNFSILSLCSAGGLMLFLGIAIVKWLINR